MMWIGWSVVVVDVDDAGRSHRQRHRAVVGRKSIDHFTTDVV